MGKNINQLPDADTPLAGTELIEVFQDGVNKNVPVSELGGSGGAGLLDVAIHADGAGNITMTNQVAAEQFLSNSNRNVTKVDLTGKTQVRLLCRVITGGAAGAKIVLKYKTGAYSDTVGDYSTIGTSEVSCSIATNNTHIDSGWINLAAGAIADVMITVTQVDGDAAADPVVASVHAQFK